MAKSPSVEGTSGELYLEGRVKATPRLVDPDVDIKA